MLQPTGDRGSREPQQRLRGAHLLVCIHQRDPRQLVALAGGAHLAVQAKHAVCCGCRLWPLCKPGGQQEQAATSQLSRLACSAPVKQTGMQARARQSSRPWRALSLAAAAGAHRAALSR